MARFTIDLADAGIVRGLLEGAPAERAEAATHALARKDESALADATKGLTYETALRELPRLSGDRAALVDALSVLEGTPAEASVRRLLGLFDAARARGLDGLRADAGEVRGFAYYTGLIFSIFAPGAGEPIGAGGRYDELLSRFGAPMPAIGLGLDLDVLGTALAADPIEEGVVVVGEASDARVGALRARGASAVAVADIEAARAYAKAWRHALIWDTAAIVRAKDDAVIATAIGATVDEAADHVVGMLRELECRPS